MSPKDRKLTVMLSETEYELLRTVATQEGYKTVSAFVRAVTVGDKKGMVAQINKNVLEILEILKEKKRQENKESTDATGLQNYPSVDNK